MSKQSRKTFTTEIGEHIISRCSMSTIWIFENIENKYTLYCEEDLHDLHGDLPFLLKRMKIEKVENLVANLHDKTEYVICIRNLKEPLKPFASVKKVYWVIKFN